jgi:hypothetical protein
MTEKDQNEYLTVEIPLSANAEAKDGITIDCLFTALDHAKAYHDHEGNYAERYENLDSYLYNQLSKQLD